MADDREQANTHITDLEGTVRIESSAPTNPLVGDMYFDTTTNNLAYYISTGWVGAPFV